MKRMDHRLLLIRGLAFFFFNLLWCEILNQRKLYKCKGQSCFLSTLTSFLSLSDLRDILGLAPSFPSSCDHLPFPDYLLCDRKHI